MIIVKAETREEEQELVATIKKVVGDREVLQREDEEFTHEDLEAVNTMNLDQIRIYVGRLVRNTGNLVDELKRMNRSLEPVGALAALDLKQRDSRPAETIVLQRAAEKAKADLAARRG